MAQQQLAKDERSIGELFSEQVQEQITNVYESAKDKIYDVTLRKVGGIMNSVSSVGKELKKSNIYNKVTENPFPLLLIGLGAGLLIFSNYKKSSGNRRADYGRNFASERSGNGKTPISEKFTETASSAYHSVADTAENAYRSVSGAAGKTYEKLGELGTTAQEQYEHYIEEKPLAVGVAAFAVGAGIGLMLPTTRYEEDLMGEMSRNLLTKAQDKTQETVDSLKNAAGNAVETVREEVGNQMPA